ncbi:MAG: ABC transporter permease [Deltaproteobacteria bacterium]|nr:ABC transporter permease [Deltaproteobacteria bacterium]
MNEFSLVLLAASVVATAAPILLASLGETLTERAGLINLSLDGTILLAAMAAFAVAHDTGSVGLGFAAAAAVGGAVAALVGFAGVILGVSQVAVGFVLTLMCRDLAYFLGNPYSRIQGPQVPPLPVPGLAELPVLGPLLFRHNAVVYLSLLLVPALWWVLYRTKWGLEVRAVGEHPEAAYARGIAPRQVQMVCAVVGGALVGLAGAAYSLALKPGWGRPQGAEGIGWIALALVIFGGWHPVKVALGAVLFALLQVAGIPLQEAFPSVPAQVFQVAPFPLMIFTLLFMGLSQRESVERWAEGRPWAKRLVGAFRGAAPRALGRPMKGG